MFPRRVHLEPRQLLTRAGRKSLAGHSRSASILDLLAHPLDRYDPCLDGSRVVPLDTQAGYVWDTEEDDYSEDSLP